MKAKKSLGQHFLKSDDALRTIIDAAELDSKDTVVEIGPGEGVLTAALLETQAKVIAIETDRRMVSHLETLFKDSIANGFLTVLFEDIRDFNITRIKEMSSSYKVVANIPYYLTGEIIRMFLESSFQPEKLVLLVQKEVAERIVAKDGKQSLLSLSVSIYGDSKIAGIVPRHFFEPAPKVDSAIIIISNVTKKRLNGVPEEKFFETIKKAFKYKRKLLVNNFKEEDKILVQNYLLEKGLNLKARAEDLALANWLDLSKTL
jgi:16S rRNA (adenine1518-N6/adenine1519-N6)-dimethyltransferase